MANNWLAFEVQLVAVQSREICGRICAVPLVIRGGRFGMARIWHLSIVNPMPDRGELDYGKLGAIR
jgi:hypothetical protein